MQRRATFHAEPLLGMYIYIYSVTILWPPVVLAPSEWLSFPSAAAIRFQSHESCAAEMAKKGAAPSGAKAANDARANALNPNNPAYDRGLAAQRAAKKEMGRKEHELNCLASRSPQQKAAYGRDVKKVVEAVHEACGGEFHVYKARGEIKIERSNTWGCHWETRKFTWFKGPLN